MRNKNVIIPITMPSIILNSTLKRTNLLLFSIDQVQFRYEHRARRVLLKKIKI